MSELDVVGKRKTAVGGQEVVTGKAVYTPDLEFPNMLVGKLLYSPYACARILSIDVTKAREIPGVAAVMTGEDIPGENSYVYWYTDQPLLVQDEVRYQGDAVAAVAAETEEIAREALMAIEVQYEPLEGVFDPEKAILKDSRQVWSGKSNAHSHYVDEWGDIEAGFAKADVIIENTYSTQYIEQAMLETEAALAYIDYDGTVVVYASAQAPHRDRKQIARALGIPETQVREITPHIGGAFGAKDEAHIQLHAALLAQKTGLPVRIVRSREESIRTHVKRHPIKILYRTGSTKDGKLTAVHLKATGDTGPYVNSGEEIMHVLANYGTGPYFVPAVRSEAFTVLTNNPICGAMRGFGIPQLTFAFERNMDELALELGLDPLEIRLLNGLRTGQQFQSQSVVRQGDGMLATLEKAAELSNWQKRKEINPKPEPHLLRGWGIGSSLHKVGYGLGITDHATATINMAPDGSVLLLTGAAEMGQGAHTILAQFAAEGLGVDPAVIKVMKPDTAIAGDAGASVASRVTTFSGNAVIRAAEPIRAVLLQLASSETGVSEEMIDLRMGFIHIEGELTNLRVADLAGKAYETNLPMQSSAHYTMDYPETPLPDGSTGFQQMASFGTHIAEVLVDVETGQVMVEKIVAVHDVGQVVNPAGVRGQIEGGTSMAFGYSVMEELIVDQGKTLNNSYDSYLIPTSFDTPDIISDVVEGPEEEAPLGAKGVGEPPTSISAAAIANAVADAIGAPITELPISPERVLEALQSRGNK